MAAQQKEQPIYSTLAHDPDAGESVDAFVVAVAERVDLLQEAEIKGELGQLARLARELVAEADSAGFGSLSSCAALVEACCLEDDAEAVHKHLVELTGIARRVRLGYRGAV
jgi:hypothetical protein